MTQESTPDKVRTVAPGLEMVIVAGELYDISDESGQGLHLKGVESPWVMQFLEAYDAFRNIRRTLGRDHEQTQASFHAVEDLWDRMPMWLVNEMPSFRAGGLVVPGGTSNQGSGGVL